MKSAWFIPLFVAAAIQLICLCPSHALDQVQVVGPVKISTSSGALNVDTRRGQTLLFVVISTASAGDNTIIAADATKKIKVLSYSLVCDGAVTVQWKSGAATALTGAMSIAANGGIVDGSGNSPGTQWLFETAANQALILNLSGAVGVRGRLTYFLEL